MKVGSIAQPADVGNAIRTTAASAPRWRTIATQVLSGLAGLVVGFVFFSLPLLVVSWLASGEDLIHQVHGIGWGVTAGLVMSVGLLSQTWRPAQRIAGLQMALLGIIALVIATPLAGSELPALAPFLLVGALLAFLHPARDELLRIGTAGRPNLAQAVIAVVAAVPLVAYALDQAGNSRVATAADPHVMPMENHYESMSAMAIALVLVGLLGAARTRGWRLPTVIAGLGAACFGLMSIVSDAAGSIGAVWGAVALVGALLHLAVGLRGTAAAGH